MPYELWTASRIVRDSKSVSTGLPDGRWVPARPLGWYSLVPRIKAAWGVFTARYDAVDWEH